jgi:mannose-6-phosphate isomerase-like protein (cupin superfamily)
VHTLLLGLALAAGVATQAPPPAQAPPSTAPRPAPAQRAPAPGRPSLQLTITDRGGAPVAGADVTLTGPVEREAQTDKSGALRFSGLRAGTYRVHVEREGFITLERELTLPASGRVTAVDLALSPAPPPPRPLPPPPAPAARATPPRPVGEARAVDVAAYVEKNFIGRNEPQRITVVGCTGYATTRVIQVREPLDHGTHDDADEMVYAVAGEATVSVNTQQLSLDAGGLVVIPRGTKHSIAKRGRNPAILLSVLSGPPCTDEGSERK